MDINVFDRNLDTGVAVIAGATFGLANMSPVQNKDSGEIKHNCRLSRHEKRTKKERKDCESLERISKDENYIESLVFKTLRTSPLSRGFELSPESEKSYSQKIIHVLQRYASDFKKGSQLEKVLVTKRTTEKIILSKESMEVMVTIER